MATAEQELYGIIREIELVEEDIRDRNRAKSDIYKEAGAKGFDKKTIRKVVAARRLDPLERDEQDTLFDSYMTAIERAEKGVAYARVENIEEFPPHNPETGELTDTQEQPEEPATKSGQRDDAVVFEDAGSSPDGNPAADAAKSETMVGSASAQITPSPETPQVIADEEAAPPAKSSATLSPSAADLPGAGKAPEAAPPPSASGASFNNPRCQHPDTCSHAHDQGSCDDCFFDWAKRPLEEQRRLWAEAMQAAETEAA